MNPIVFLQMPEDCERAVIQWIQILGVRYSGYRVIIPLQETSLHGGVEAGKHFVLTDAVYVGRVSVCARRVACVRRACRYVVLLCVTVFSHL